MEKTDHNSHDQIELRRFRSSLEVAGFGYMVFGIWSVIKLFMMSTMQEENRNLFYETVEKSPDDRVAIIAIYVVFLLISAGGVLIFHFLVGNAAVRYSRGTGKKKTFLFFAVIAMAVNIFGLPLYFYNVSKGVMNKVDETIVASLLVDITVIFLFVDMIWSTHHIDRLTHRDGVVGPPAGAP